MHIYLKLIKSSLKYPVILGQAEEGNLMIRFDFTKRIILFYACGEMLSQLWDFHGVGQVDTDGRMSPLAEDN